MRTAVGKITYDNIKRGKYDTAETVDLIHADVGTNPIQFRLAPARIAPLTVARLDAAPWRI